MSIDEVIKNMESVAEENQRVVDTGIVFDDVTIDMLYCDDTEVIEEHLANYQRCADLHRQIADWLKELKQLREQTRWIPVSERLPNRDECIKNNGLFNVSDGNRSYSEWFDMYDKQMFGKPTMMGFRVDRAVTAWMLLPELYKAESEVEE